MNLKPVLSTNFLSVILVIFVLSIFSISVTASDDQAKTGKDFNPGDMITKHIADAHEWHFATIGKFHISIPLPIIIFSKGKGLDVFMFTKVKHPGDEFRGYSSSHEGKIIHADESEAMIWNFSITKVVVSMLISIFLMLWIFISVARTYKRREGQAPKGLQSLIEPLILFIKDDVAVPMLGDKHVKYLPYLLTVFFFIWINKCFSTR
ncbi:MAG: F0F1 ATP synthase subunit A [Bacteroidetes bacterium]|nr:F0F1 ATP synthase subunit A [Bacteroidota bacterium]